MASINEKNKGENTLGDNIRIGNVGEIFAAEMLKIKGYEILIMNYRNKLGEIDIIAQKNMVLTFVEVKTRQSIKMGYPCEAVNHEKRRKIKKTALAFICENKIKYQEIEFQVIEIFVNQIKEAF